MALTRSPGPFGPCAEWLWIFPRKKEPQKKYHLHLCLVPLLLHSQWRNHHHHRHITKYSISQCKHMVSSEGWHKEGFSCWGVASSVSKAPTQGSWIQLLPFSFLCRHPLVSSLHTPLKMTHIVPWWGLLNSQLLKGVLADNLSSPLKTAWADF